jgi:hypothetical protein
VTWTHPRDRENWAKRTFNAGTRERRKACPHIATRMVTRYGERIIFCIACGHVTHTRPVA